MIDGMYVIDILVFFNNHLLRFIKIYNRRIIAPLTRAFWHKLEKSTSLVAELLTMPLIEDQLSGITPLKLDEVSCAN